MPPFYTAAGSLKIRIEVASLLNATLIYYYDYDMPIGSKQSLILTKKSKYKHNHLSYKKKGKA